MNANTPNKLPRSGSTAAFPAAKRGERNLRRPGRVVDRLAALYDFISGPAMTARERTRADLLDIRNAQAKTLYG